jgi:hypothetical protein
MVYASLVVINGMDKPLQFAEFQVNGSYLSFDN